MRVIIAVLLLSCAACELTRKPEDSQGTAEIAYRWDAAHRLCFAMMASYGYGGYQSVSITHVPLTAVDCK